ncbi:Nephrocystin-4 [Gonapodya sp. JEL0774]|nr:Nephrocystin-4 [Gonapodya sp. JEL0774]
MSVTWAAHHARLAGSLIPPPPSVVAAAAESPLVASPLLSAFSLSLSAILSVPIPPLIPDSALQLSTQSTSPPRIAISFAVSWFDSESGRFFGRTCRAVGCQDVAEQSRNRANGAINGTKRLPNLANQKSRRVNIDGQDDDGSSSSASSSLENLDGTPTDPDRAAAGKLSALAIGISGRRITVETDCTLFFHTPSRSSSLMVVVETIVTGKLKLWRPDLSNVNTPLIVSAGWSLLPVFEPARGGLDMGSEGQEYRLGNDAQDRERECGLKTVVGNLPLHSGTPRLLLLLHTPIPNPPAATIPTAAVGYTLACRPDLVAGGLTSSIQGWEFMEANEPVGGVVGVIDQLGRAVAWKKEEWSEASIGKLRLALHPTPAAFHSLLLLSVASAVRTSLGLPATPPQNVPPPLSRILSHTLCLGTHNGHCWLAPPARVSLAPSVTVEGWYEFGGQIVLPVVLGDPRCVVVVGIMVEMDIEVDVDREKGIVGTRDSEGTVRGKEMSKVLCERTVDLGWAWWTPEAGAAGEVRLLALTHPPQPSVNPFGSHMAFCPPPNELSPERDVNSEGGLGAGSRAAHLGITGVTAPDRPVVVAFEAKGDGIVVPPAEIPVPAPMEEPSWQPQPPPPEPPNPPPPSRARSSSSASLVPRLRTPTFSTTPNPSPLCDRHPVVRPIPLPLPVSHCPISRTERARLHLAEFPTPSLNRPPVVVAVDDLTRRANPTKEEVIMQEIWITYAGVTWTEECDDGLSWKVRKVRLVHQFWDTAAVTSERACVWTGAIGANKSKDHFGRIVKGRDNGHWEQDPEDGEEWPGILWRTDKEGVPDFSRPAGLTFVHLVDPTHASSSDSPNAPPGLPFFRYLARSTMSVDLFDPDSGTYLGQACVPLRGLMLEGRSAVRGTLDVDVLAAEPPDDRGSTGAVTHPADPYSYLDRYRTIGKLHLLLTNVARPDLGLSVQSAMEATRKRDVVARDFRDGLRSRRLQEGTRVLALKVLDTNPELQALLRRSMEERALVRQSHRVHEDGTKREPMDSEEESRRKASKAKEWFVQEGLVLDMKGQSGGLEFSYCSTRQERQRDMQTISVFRDRAKPGAISSSLEKSITSHHSIYASFARGYFFEFLFTNPYAVEHTFTVSFEDEELHVVADSAKWRYLRRVHGIPSSVEENFLRLRPKDGNGQVFLMPNETVSVPFVFQSLLTGRNVDTEPLTESHMRRASHGENEERATRFGYRVVDGPGPAMEHLGQMDDDVAAIRARTIKISILNNHNKPIAILDVRIIPRHHHIDRSIRLYKAENEVSRKTLKFIPTWNQCSDEDTGDRVSTVHDAANPSKKYAFATADDVVCSLNESGQNNNAYEVSLKFRFPKVPNVRRFFLLFYDDPYHTSLLECWQINLHPLIRMDVNCILGQTNIATMVVRGSSYSRTVQCFSTMPEDLKTLPAGPFILTANALNEVKVLTRPKSVGVKEIMLNIVEVGSGQLVAAWSVVCHCLEPTVTKSFDVRLQVGRSSSKRMSFTNPYPSPKLFTLRTNKPDFLCFKELELSMDGGATHYIHLRFAPRATPAIVEALVFINDEDDRLEECLAVKCEVVN